MGYPVMWLPGIRRTAEHADHVGDVSTLLLGIERHAKFTPHHESVCSYIASETWYCFQWILIVVGSSLLWRFGLPGYWRTLGLGLRLIWENVHRGTVDPLQVCVSSSFLLAWKLACWHSVNLKHFQVLLQVWRVFAMLCGWPLITFQ